MAISFNNIPANIRVPFAYFELNSGTAAFQSTSRLLIIGQKLASGTATADEPILVTGSEDALFGRGSQAAIMYRIAAKIGTFQEIWVAPVADAAGTAATATITVAGAPVTQGGSIALYIGGVRLSIPVTTSDTNATLAAAIASAINTSTEALEASAAAVGAVVTLTALNKGTVGNDLHVSVNLNSDDSAYGATLLTVVDFAGGATDPSIANVLANLASDAFDFICAPYSDTANVALMEAFLDSRWLPGEALFGHYITFKAGSAGALQTYGSARNNANITCYGGYKFESSVPRLAAALGVLHAVHLQAPPELSRPLQTLALANMRGPKLVSDRFTVATRNTLLYSGISTLMIERDGTVAIDRAITMYQTNAYGATDVSWLSVNTRAQQMYGLRFLKAYITSTFPRCALVDDNPNGIQNFVTVADVRQAFVHAYAQLVTVGVFENLDTFEQLLIVERDTTDANRVNAYLPTDSVNQLIILAANVTSFLQFSDAA